MVKENYNHIKDLYVNVLGPISLRKTASNLFWLTVLGFTVKCSDNNANQSQENIATQTKYVFLAPEIKEMAHYGIDVQNNLLNFRDKYHDSTDVKIQYFVKQADSILNNNLIVQKSPLEPEKAKEYTENLFLINNYFLRANSAIQNGANLDSIVAGFKADVKF